MIFFLPLYIFSLFSLNIINTGCFIVNSIRYDIYHSHKKYSKTILGEKGENIERNNNENKTSLLIPFMYVLRHNISSSRNASLPRDVGKNITMPDINDIEEEDMFEKFQRTVNKDDRFKKHLIEKQDIYDKFENASNKNDTLRQQLILLKIKEQLQKRDNENMKHLFVDEDKDIYEAPQRNDSTPHSRSGGIEDNEGDVNNAFEEHIRRTMGEKMGVRFFIRKNDENDKKEEESENFQIVKNLPYNFNQVGGYDNVKLEMLQSVDMLKNYEKYAKYNVRVPKGLILEGPPGNGKTLLARAFSGEVNSSFIAVSGSQFQEKYVGVGASRIRELFELARKNTPCVIFIDEVDALGRSRSMSGVDANTERDQTLNELLVALDGYKNSSGIFVVAATNRVDLLDPALMRPGRIDKKIYIGNPDAKTREAILDIHIEGKPKADEVKMSNLIEMTNGLSGAQIENLLNEAMLNALRNNNTEMTQNDLEQMLGRVYGGYQPVENAFSDEMIHRISIHEMGHAIVGLMSPNHVKLVKVCLNLWSPTSPGYTIFEHPEVDSLIYTKERLMERLTVLLGGRIAEEVFFGNSITSGASNDLDQAYKLAEQMIVKYGMGKKTVYAYNSENSKEFIDRDIERLIESAYQTALSIIINSKDIIEETAIKLAEQKILVPDEIFRIIHSNNMKVKKYSISDPLNNKYLP